MASAKGRVQQAECFSDHWSKFLSCAQSSLYLSLLILKLNHSGISRKFVNHWFYLFITRISNFKFYQDFLICKTRKRETFYNFLLIFTKGGRKLSIPNLISFANKIGTRSIHIQKYPKHYPHTWMDTFLSLPWVEARQVLRGTLWTGSGGPSGNIQSCSAVLSLAENELLIGCQLQNNANATVTLRAEIRISNSNLLAVCSMLRFQGLFLR